ncbi:MAG: hypothetical protein J6L64_00205 [Opitutales bacterium]|nr:hypothetical protein [Opitutales bacterium]
MKLGKEEFALVLMEAAHHTSGIRGGRYVEIHDAFVDDSLEIEGYERVQWMKFDPSDPKTFPPCNTKILLTVAGADEDVLCVCQTHRQERQNARGLPAPFTHWRRSPTPPVETEEK